MRAWLLIPVALVALAAGPVVHPTLAPVDDAARDPDFLAFRSRLQRTVEQRDVAALLAIVDPNIRNSFGDDGGIDAFKKMWRLAEPDSDVWHELGTLLSLGGTFDGPDVFVAPYVFSRWPDDLDGFDYAAVIGSSVRVRAAPAPSAPVLTAVSFAILPVRSEYFEGERDWTSVTLADGRKGFVAAHLIRKPIDYRAYFSRSGGRWLMTALIGGD